MKGMYAAVIHPRKNGNGFECRVPDFPGCVTSGATMAERRGINCSQVLQDALKQILV